LNETSLAKVVQLHDVELGLLIELHGHEDRQLAYEETMSHKSLLELRFK
jgi:hypothetical protein